MTPDQLKNSILQLAIQGKLTESWRLSVKRLENRDERKENCLPNRVFCHNRHCEPAESWHGNPDLLYADAETLLKTISEEKEALIKQGKLKKDKNESTIIKRGNSYFEIIGTTEKCIDDELPFEIPDTWRWARLGSCGVFTRGSGIKRNETVEKGLPCIRYGQLYTTYKTRFSKAISFVSNEIFDKCHKIHKNDILMALTGENNFDIALAVAYEGNEELAMGGDMTKFSNHCMNPLYLVYVINSVYGISCKSKLATGNIIVHISNDKLASILVPLPPLAEQRRIVAKIEELLPLVEKYGKAYNKLEVLNKNFPAEIKKSILQYAIQGKLTEEFRAQSVGRKGNEATPRGECCVVSDECLKASPRGEVARSAGVVTEFVVNPNSMQQPSSQANYKNTPLGKGRSHTVTERFSNNNEPSKNPPVRQSLTSPFKKEGILESAEELLARIQAEKAELIKQGKIKKDKNESTIIKRGNSYFEKVGTTEKCIDDELPFEIPDTWRWARLRNIVYNRPQKKPDKEFCYIDIGSIDNKKQCLSDNENIIKPENAPSRARKIISKGDIIYSTVRPYLHNMAIIDKDFSHEPIASTGFATMVSLINNKYLFNYLLSPEFDNYANSTDNSKGVAYPAINDEKLYKALIAIPPLAEQHRIVAKIEELFAIAETLTNKV